MEVSHLKKLIDKKIKKKNYILNVDKTMPIKQLIQQNNLVFRSGNAYYELVKPEKVSVTKKMIVYDKKRKSLYIDIKARKLLGISTLEGVQIAPDEFKHEKFKIFIQSKSATRRLSEGTILLYIIYKE
ncbi:MAG: hypothetical protein ACFFBH_14635 [Promethearchaeota archaeon]